MYPLLDNRDLLDIAPADRIRRGDIVLFRSHDHDGQWIAHRVMRVDGKRLWAGGDNARRPDERVLDRNEIAGVAVMRWRGGKRLKLYRGPAGRAQSFVYARYHAIRSIGRRLLVPLQLPPALRSFITSNRPLRVVVFGPGHQVRRLYLGRLQIGSWSDQRQCWSVRFPYSIVFGREI